MDRKYNYRGENYFPQRQNYGQSPRTAPAKTIRSLFIYDKLPQIADAIKKSMITIVKCDTGSGKTIGIPNYLSMDKAYKNIFCSVPMIAGTISAHKFQSELLPYRNMVGYACEGNVRYYPDTKIVYCTTGHLFNKMVKTVADILNSGDNRNRWFCSVLIIDEFHTRAKESDMCLCLWTAAFKAWKEDPTKYPKPPKLVIMSATLEDNIKTLLPTEPSVLSYTIKTHEIKLVFDDVASSTFFKPDDDELYLRAAKVAKKYHDEKYDGVYMIFVPGKQELELVEAELRKEIGPDAIIFQAHGDLMADEIMKIHDPVEEGKRKIVVTTNIAECSITIENVSLIINTMTHREASSGLDESLKLDLHWISKSNAIQRMGRTGRTCPGICVVLMSEGKYNMLPDNITPEISRVSISYDILKLMKFGLDPHKILGQIISEWQITMHVDLLKELGFIRESDGMVLEKLWNRTSSGLRESREQSSRFSEVTDMGDFCSEFPLSIRKSAMIYHLRKVSENSVVSQEVLNINESATFLHLVVICTLNCYGSGLFHTPRRNRDEDSSSFNTRIMVVRENFEDKYAGYSDVDTIFKIWIDICQSIYPYYLKDLKIYCVNNNLNFRRFKEAVLLSKQCVGIARHHGLKAGFKPFIPPQMDLLSKTFYHLLALTHQDYSTRIYFDHKDGISANCGGFVHKVDNRAIHTMPVGENIRQNYFALVRSQRTIKNGYVLRIINVLHSIPQDEDDENNVPSIFSSDIESDTEQTANDKTINKFLARIESSMPHDGYESD